MTNPFENDDPWRDRLSEYLDGLLTEVESRALEEHLHICERCRTALSELRAVVEHLRADQTDAIPEGAWPRIASRLTPRQIPSKQIARERAWGTTGGLQAATVQRITTAASFAVTLAGGIWLGAALCITSSVWTPPGWMHLWPRASHPSTFRLPSSLTLPAYGADSVLDEWTPLRRSLAALDRQIAETGAALKEQPENQTLQRAVKNLTVERDNMRAMLDSLESSHTR